MFVDREDCWLTGCFLTKDIRRRVVVVVVDVIVENRKAFRLATVEHEIIIVWSQSVRYFFLL